MGNNSTNNFLLSDEKLLVKPDSKVSLKDYGTEYTAGFKSKDEAKEMLEADIERMEELQDMLYASAEQSLLIVFQAMDAAGKDGTIKHVMSGLNPQGVNVTSFKQPSHLELAHDFLWRIHYALPPNGKIGIFNRSHYEEVLVVRVHPEYLLSQKLPGINSTDDLNKNFWENRFEQINNFEKHLSLSGTKIIKFFLHVSKKEQKKRFLERIDQPEKNWKFSSADVKERGYWKDYQKAYEEMLNATSTKHAPWYVIPADNKWFMRAAVGDIVVGHLEEMNLSYPVISDDEKAELEKCRAALLSEDE